MFSTLRDGTIVKGLDGVPSEGPVLLVGYHMLMGLELPGLIEGFLREKKVLVRGLAHPELFTLSSASEFSYLDYMKVFGAIPVTPSNFFKLLATKSHVLLYPGGAREALHRKVSMVKLTDISFFLCLQELLHFMPIVCDYHSCISAFLFSVLVEVVTRSQIFPGNLRSDIQIFGILPHDDLSST